MAIAIDTLKIYERLKAADLNEKAAKEIAEVFKDASESTTIKREDLLGDVATKADVSSVRTEIAEVKGEIRRIEGKLEGELKTVRLEMKMYFLILLFVIILSNPKALEIIGKLLGLVK